MMNKAAVIMGSDSDLNTMKECVKTLREFGIETTVHILSAHRTPAAIEQLAKNAKNNGYKVMIAAAGKAAHLAGVIAAYTILPVIGVPIKSSTMDGLDSLLSMVQMPSGIPVATVAIDGAKNAALLAVQIMATNDDKLSDKLLQFKQKMADDVMAKNKNIQI